MNPHYSDDGRFFWTGTQWLPVRPTSLDQATGLFRLVLRLCFWWFLLWVLVVMIVMFWKWLLAIIAVALLGTFLILAWRHTVASHPRK